MYPFAEQIPALLECLRAPLWAIMDDRLEPLIAIHDQLKLGMLPVMAARDSAPKSIPVSNGVAVLSVSGPIFKRPNVLTEFYGWGTSTDKLVAQLRETEANPDVHARVLWFDSGGGEVTGSEENSAAIRAMRGSKPIEAVIQHGYSAAYWLAAAADRVTLAEQTSGAGSIGVIAVYGDLTEMYKKDGIGIKVIKSRKLKAAGNPFETMSPEDEAAIRRNIDAVDFVFASAVVSHRGGRLSIQRIDALAGGTLVGREAIEAGLADRIATLDQVVTELQDRALSRRSLVSAFFPGTLTG